MRVFVVEDSLVMRERLSALLGSIAHIEIIGHSPDEAGAIEHIDKLLPDAVVLDISLQPGSGISVLEHIKKHHGEVKVMMLTNYIDDYYVKRCKAAGADFFFDKTFQLDQLRMALWQSENCEAFVNSSVTAG